MEKKFGIKLIKTEVEVILNEYKITYAVGIDEGDVIIACPHKSNAQFVYANLKSRFNKAKYWEYTSEIFIKNDYIVHIRLY